MRRLANLGENYASDVKSNLIKVAMYSEHNDICFVETRTKLYVLGRIFFTHQVNI